MVINWDYVKKRTLWSYEDLIKKLKQTLSYDFVQHYYNHNMDEACDYVNEVHAGYFQHHGDRVWLDGLITNFTWLKRAGVQNYLDLVEQVDDRDKCEMFLKESGLAFGDLIETLNYLLRWVLPFPTPLREFFNTDDAQQMAYFEALKQRRLTSNLDLLAQGRTAAQRAHLAQETGIPLNFLLPLIHKADLARLAYVRGKTVQHLCGGGYDTLAKLAAADLPEMEVHMRAYYQTLGKRFADFRSVVQLASLVGGARILPAVVEA
ncbi:MAG: DUF4332 domain-containing protein [Caldilineaceae bacterium]